MIKVLQIARMNKGSGVASFLMNYYKNIDRSKIQFIFISDQVWENENYKDEIEKLGGKLYITGKYTHIFSYILAINKIINDEKPDIIHCHEAVVSLIALFIAKIKRIKVRIAHSHNIFISSKIKNLIFKISRPFFSVLATDLWACSMEAGEYLFGKKSFVINNAIGYNCFKFDTDKREKFRNFFGLNHKIVFGTIGRFNHQKNYPFCLEVFEEFHKQNPDSVLLICGDGELRPEIENIIQSKNLTDCVILLGNITNVNEILNCFDIFIFTSHYEGLGIALVEAQTNGLKCFAASQAVPKICNIDDKLILLDKYDEYLWVDTIKANLQYERNMDKETLIKYGFEIQTEAKKIEEKYVELLNLKDEK